VSLLFGYARFPSSIRARHKKSNLLLFFRKVQALLEIALLDVN
jgi:hypothetical protein